MQYSSLNQLFVELTAELYHNGSAVHARGSSQKELIFQSFCLTDPTALDITVVERKFSTNYAISEWLWYLSANRKINNIGKFAKIWRDIGDEHGEVESNYGAYFAPQWDWVINELIRDNDTRRATIAINQPYHKDANSKDYPCTHYVQFFIRDRKLHLGVSMRSNDVIFGLCNDVFTFCLFQQMMLNELRAAGVDVELGTYHHNAGSLHLYEMHYKKAHKIIHSKEKNLAGRKFVLRGDFCWTNYQYSELQFPVAETEKKQLVKLARKAKEELFI